MQIAGVVRVSHASFTYSRVEQIAPVYICFANYVQFPSVLIFKQPAIILGILFAYNDPTGKRRDVAAAIRSLVSLSVCVRERACDDTREGTSEESSGRWH